MKRFAIIAIAGAFILTGCSTSPEFSEKSAAQAAENYYNEIISSTMLTTQAFEQINSVVETTLDEETNKKYISELETDGVPNTTFESMNEELAQELFLKYSELNPMSDYYDYSDMTTGEKALFNMMEISTNIGFSNLGNSGVTFKVDKSSPVLNDVGQNAYIDFADVLFVVNGQEQQNATERGVEGVVFSYKNDEWKYDASIGYEKRVQSAEEAFLKQVN